MATPSESQRTEEIRRAGRFQIEDIPLAASVFQRNLSMATEEWSTFAGTTLDLPSWFELGLDPDSPAYKEQQLKLWRAISGRDRPYEPLIDEEYPVGPDADAVRFPGYFGNREPNAVDHASDHLMATALMLRHSKIGPGAWALEYGAGFGQTALALSRLGVNVDTVDISTHFCKCVKDTADFFGTKLTPFRGLFGQNPRPGQKYDLIYFYEAFHHSLDFHQVVGQVRDHLAPGGRVLLCGEPILARTCPAIPYPWGMRLDAGTVVVTRTAGWLELGFVHEYIVELFTRNRFVGTHFPCASTALGNLYSFEPVAPGRFFPALTPADPASRTWYGQERDGRWSTARSEMRIELDPARKQISLEVMNSLPVRKSVTIENAGKAYSFELKPGTNKTLSIPNRADPHLVLLSETHSPQDLGVSPDPRQLGVFVTAVYCS
jgi:SAM-dependent methyltransferase